MWDKLMKKAFCTASYRFCGEKENEMKIQVSLT
jgi:hypothetical protein